MSGLLASLWICGGRLRLGLPDRHGKGIGVAEKVVEPWNRFFHHLNPKPRNIEGLPLLEEPALGGTPGRALSFSALQSGQGANCIRPFT
jgi:hypothetical protein